MPLELNKEMSYKEMCRQMNEKESPSGNVRKYQFERWAEQYDIKKVNRGKYIALRQYSSEESDMLKIEKNYANFVQAALLNYIADRPITDIYTYTSLREGLSMVNKNYSKYKHCLDELNLNVPKSFSIESLEELENNWFNIADRHDKYVLNSTLKKLRERGLIDYIETYVFYTLVKLPNGNMIYSNPTKATDEEKAKLEQVKIEFMKEHNMQSSQDIYKHGEFVTRQYYAAVNLKVKELGYDTYARAFVISRPHDLKKMVNFFAPKFNKAQVDRLLKSKRFKMIPQTIHEQMTDKTVRIE